MTAPHNPPAFPSHAGDPDMTDPRNRISCGGMTLRDYYAGQALANPHICTGLAPSWQVVKWFGEYANGVTAAQISARQAIEYADALLAARGAS